MSPIGDILITINNYSHDVAAAFLAVSLLVVRLLSKKYPASGDRVPEVSFVRACMGVTRIARYSLCWFLVAGVPRAIFFRQCESSRAGDLQIIAVVIQYAGVSALAGIGLFSWSRLSRKIGYLKSKHNING
jgi:hypothetical protein